jgi:hypothetical protein
MTYVSTLSGSSSGANFVLSAAFITNMDQYCEVILVFDIAMLQDLQRQNYN